jgi:hypothetical protein
MTEAKFEWTEEKLSILIDLRLNPENELAIRSSKLNSDELKEIWFKIGNALGASNGQLKQIRERFSTEKSRNMRFFKKYQKNGKISPNWKYFDRFRPYFENMVKHKAASAYEDEEQAEVDEKQEDSDSEKKEEADNLHSQREEVVNNSQTQRLIQERLQFDRKELVQQAYDQKQKENLLVQAKFTNLLPEIPQAKVNKLKDRDFHQAVPSKNINEKWTSLFEKCESALEVRKQYYQVKSESIKNVYTENYNCKKIYKKLKRMDKKLNKSNDFLFKEISILKKELYTLSNNIKLLVA